MTENVQAQLIEVSFPAKIFYSVLNKCCKVQNKQIELNFRKIGILRRKVKIQMIVLYYVTKI